MSGVSDSARPQRDGSLLFAAALIGLVGEPALAAPVAATRGRAGVQASGGQGFIAGRQGRRRAGGGGARGGGGGARAAGGGGARASAGGGGRQNFNSNNFHRDVSSSSAASRNVNRNTSVNRNVNVNGGGNCCNNYNAVPRGAE